MDRGLERHTTQGRARGQKHGTLDQDSVSVPHGMDEAYARGNIHLMNQTAKKGGAVHVPPGQMITVGGCWCGEPVGHHWKEHPGEPHPGPHRRERPTPPRVLSKRRRLALQEQGICPYCMGAPDKTRNGWPWCDLCQGVGVFPPLKPDEYAKFVKLRDERAKG